MFTFALLLCLSGCNLGGLIAQHSVHTCAFGLPTHKQVCVSPCHRIEIGKTDKQKQREEAEALVWEHAKQEEAERQKIETVPEYVAYQTQKLGSLHTSISKAAVAESCMGMHHAPTHPRVSKLGYIILLGGVHVVWTGMLQFLSCAFAQTNMPTKMQDG